MKHASPILTRSQWIGAIIVLTLLAIIFIGLHFLPQPNLPEESSSEIAQQAITNHKKNYYDSLRHIRTARYDSLRLVRRDSLHRMYLEHRDSVHRADSLWWDSVKQATPHPIKKDTVLSINAADTNELKLIQGIGSGMAHRIVRYRDRLGGFTSVYQLLDDQLYQDQYGHSIRARYRLPDSVLRCFFVEIDSVKPIPVNKASVERLQSHPYISHSLAKEIYTLRRQHITLRSFDELRGLPHMSDSLQIRLFPYLNFEK